MKKKLILSIVIILIFVTVLNMKPIFSFVLDSVINIITTQLDKEEQERLESIDRGEIIRGKDTMLIWNNKYQMLHQTGDDGFFRHNSDGTIDDIIRKIYKYKPANKKSSVFLEKN